MRSASEISGLLASELMERDVEIRRLQAEVRRLEIALERSRRPEPTAPVVTAELAQRDALICQLQDDVRRLETEHRLPKQPDRPSRPAPAKRTYRIKEACAALGIGRTKLYEMINRGELSTFSIGGSRLIRHEALEALISANRDAKP